MGEKKNDDILPIPDQLADILPIPNPNFVDISTVVPFWKISVIFTNVIPLIFHNPPKISPNFVLEEIQPILWSIFHYHSNGRALDLFKNWWTFILIGGIPLLISTNYKIGGNAFL